MSILSAPGSVKVDGCVREVVASDVSVTELGLSLALGVVFFVLAGLCVVAVGVVAGGVPVVGGV